MHVCEYVHMISGVHASTAEKPQLAQNAQHILQTPVAHDYALQIQKHAYTTNDTDPNTHTHTHTATLQARLQELSSPASTSSSQEGFAQEFQPERLFSGYNLAGGDHPGERLDAQRHKWLQKPLTSGGGSDPLIAKRRAIRSLLLKLAEGTPKDEAAPKPETESSASEYSSDSSDSVSGALSRPRRDTRVTQEKRDEIGFVSAERKRELAAIHPEAMRGAVYQHFIHQLSKGAKQPMLFDSSGHAR
jgi:hypothetical protein